MQPRPSPRQERTLPWARLLPVALTAIALAACLGDDVLRIECQGDEDCEADQACFAQVCITKERVPTPPLSGDTGACGPSELDCDGRCTDTNSDPAHCGGCGKACLGGWNELATCNQGECRTECEPGWVRLSPESPDCDYLCTPTVPPLEVCDGLDNDCDGRIDSDDPKMVLRACSSQDGVCEGAVASCVDGAFVPCDGNNYLEISQGTWEPREELCDGLDNDCDARVDPHCCNADQEPYVLLDLQDVLVTSLLPGTPLPQLTSLDTITGAITASGLNEDGSRQGRLSESLTLCTTGAAAGFAADNTGTRALVFCPDDEGQLVDLHLLTGERTQLLQLGSDALPQELTLSAKAGRTAWATLWSGPGDTNTLTLVLQNDEDSELLVVHEDVPASTSSIALALQEDLYLLQVIPARGDVILRAWDMELQPGAPLLLRDNRGSWPVHQTTPTALYAMGRGGLLAAWPGDQGAPTLTWIHNGHFQSTRVLQDAPALAMSFVSSDHGHHLLLLDASSLQLLGFSDEAAPISTRELAWQAPPATLLETPSGFLEDGILHLVLSPPFDSDEPDPEFRYYRLGPDGAPWCPPTP